MQETLEKTGPPSGPVLPLNLSRPPPSRRPRCRWVRPAQPSRPLWAAAYGGGPLAEGKASLLTVNLAPSCVPSALVRGPPLASPPLPASSSGKSGLFSESLCQTVFSGVLQGRKAGRRTNRPFPGTPRPRHAPGPSVFFEKSKELSCVEAQKKFLRRKIPAMQEAIVRGASDSAGEGLSPCPATFVPPLSPLLEEMPAGQPGFSNL